MDNKPSFVSSTFSRREFIRCVGYSSLHLSLGSIVGCGSTREEREFFIKSVFTIEPNQVFEDFAFAIIPSQKDSALDYLDLKCAACGLAFRTFLYGVDLASAFLVTCPECELGIRVGITVSHFLFEQLVAYGIRKAVAFVTPDGYLVHKVSPLHLESGTIGVGRSAACYGIANHEPDNLFQRTINAVPNQIYYFTEIDSRLRPTMIWHVWRNNGQLTDRIPLEVGSSRWRTWSMKRNLAPGVWIVTTETEGGAILDVREFQIASRLS
jgi:Protein of unknown function (DUF2914)